MNLQLNKTLEYSQQEIEEFDIKIPTDAEIEVMLQNLNKNMPIRAGTNSQNWQTDNGFCVCSQLAAGMSSPEACIEC